MLLDALVRYCEVGSDGRGRVLKGEACHFVKSDTSSNAALLRRLRGISSPGPTCPRLKNTRCPRRVWQSLRRQRKTKSRSFRKSIRRISMSSPSSEHSGSIHTARLKLISVNMIHRENALYAEWLEEKEREEEANSRGGATGGEGQSRIFFCYQSTNTDKPYKLT